MKVFVTFVVGLKTQNPVSTDFSATGDSFLMSAVALGETICSFFSHDSIEILAGFVNIMPMVFGDLKQSREGVILFLISIYIIY
jgi:hypothetical protein